jgi:CelD/BcsL family acetyltransferase involved in cellulose biosynthesis
MNVRVVPAAALTPAELDRWSALQRARPLYRSPFFRPEFTLAVARVRDVRVAIIEGDGSMAGFFPFEVGHGRAGRAVGRPFSDYHGPVLDDPAALDARELVRACGLGTWSFDHLPAGLTPFAPYAHTDVSSPCVDLSEGFEAYLAARRRHSDVRGALRKARKLAREVGPLRFVAQADAPELFAQTIEWKRRQYAATGVRDVLGDADGRELVGHVSVVRSVGFGCVLSTLYAGDVVAGLHLALRSGEVWHSWFPAFNPGLRQYSPGLVLMLELARAAPALGVHEIDLGKGEARYKQALATGSVPLHEGSVGAGALSALPVRAQASARRALRAAGVHRAVRRALRRGRPR